VIFHGYVNVYQRVRLIPELGAHPQKGAQRSQRPGEPRGWSKVLVVGLAMVVDGRLRFCRMICRLDRRLGKLKIFKKKLNRAKFRTNII
jgi:hypothetical protein